MGSQPPSISQSESDLARLFDLSVDLFCVAGFDGYLKRVNLAFERTLGYSRDELMSRPYLDFVHPESLQPTRDALADLQRGIDVIGFETRIVCADGSSRWLEWNTRTMPEEGFVYGVGRDVTDRRYAEAELREAHEMVEASHAELRTLADEQAALRRVATLVAEGISPDDVFAAVAGEVARVVHVPLVSIVRFEGEHIAIELASFTEAGELFAVGTRWPLDGTNVLAMVRSSCRPARIDDYSGLEGVIAETVRRAGIQSTVGIPIVVDGLLWGTMVVSSTELLPEGTEERLAHFTELVATAIANADSKAALARLADEQAALRRVATLVAQGVPPAEVFSAVSEEVGRLFDSEAAVGRFEPDGAAIVVVGIAQDIEGIGVGTRWEPDEALASTSVFRTGRSARRDEGDWRTASGPVPESLRRMGIQTSVASPIVVEGRLWGAMTVSTTREPLPADAEERLVKFTELVATAIANAESREELTASRARIVAAFDDARRRIERDLHDGAQQRLVSIMLELRSAEQEPAPDIEELRRELSRVSGEIESVLVDLREMSRGIHPATLAQGGLGPGLKMLARRSPIPVEIDVRAEARWPERVEVAAYYVVSEALTNAAKYARASVVHVLVEARDKVLHVAVRDDGVGGADPARGSGLLGLRDRVEAIGGALTLHSPPGTGTSLHVDLPVAED